jgi:hypothetical protein
MCESKVFEWYCNKWQCPHGFRHKAYKVLRRLERPCFASIERMIAKNTPINGDGDGITCPDVDMDFEGFNFTLLDKRRNNIKHCPKCQEDLRENKKSQTA